MGLIEQCAIMNRDEKIGKLLEELEDTKNENKVLKRALRRACSKYLYKQTYRECPHAKGEKPDCKVYSFDNPCSDDTKIDCWVEYALENSR